MQNLIEHRVERSTHNKMQPPPAPPTQKVIINSLLICLACCLAQLIPRANQVGAATSPHTKPQSPNVTQQTQEATTTDKATKFDDLLKETSQLLDSLEQRLAVVSNQMLGKTPTSADKKSPSGQPGAWRDDAELTSLAEGFSSERRSSVSGEQQQSSSSMDLVSATASNPQLAVTGVGEPPGTRNGRQLGDEPLPVLGARAASGNQGGRFDNDFTERHIRFSLDLMRAVFAQHSYTAKSNTLDSFLISPVSLQLVLMMMHLGARGATKRELSHALHLLDSSPVVPLHNHHNHLVNEAVGKPGPSGATSATATTNFTLHSTNLRNNSSNNNSSGGGGKNSKLTRRHQQPNTSAAAAAIPARQSQAHQANQNSNNNNVNAAAAAAAGQREQQSHQQQQSQREQLNNVHEQFGNALRQLLKDSTVAKALTSANQIFLQRDLPLAPHYEWAVKHYYGADLRQVDFQNQPADNVAPLSAASSGAPKSANATAALAGANSTQQQQQSVQQMINDWVERQTRGKISNFLASPVPTSTLLMALNVLFFKGDWQYKFDPQDTDSDAWFTQTSLRTVKLPMMVNKLPLAHAHDPAMKTSIIELPYKAQRLGLFILLPDEIDGIFDTMQALNSSSFANLISMMRKSDNTPGGGGVNVRIPKFSIESSPRMSQILSQQLGLKTLFTPDQADLSGMFGPSGKQTGGSNSSSSGQHQHRHHHHSPQVGLDELLHKAVLQVHEQGSVAAAASATIVERVGLFNGQYFEADHPFLLFLMDKQTGLVLFSGVFAGPPGSGQEVAPPPSAAASDQQPTRANSTQVTPGSGGGGSGGNNSGNPSSIGRNPKQQQQQQQQQQPQTAQSS